MMLETSRELIVFDAETTGTDTRRDQIIELCVQHGLEDDSPSRVWRFRPSVPITPGAQAVHGISMADVESEKTFAERADEIRAVFSEARIWVGYNVSFDIEMLQAEFRRLRQPEIDLSSREVIDAFRLWQRCEPRSLQDAHRRFVGGDFESAHSALADVTATGRVLRGMIEHFELPQRWDEVAAVCEPERRTWVGPSRHIRWSEEGQACLGFGRHAGVPLTDLASGPDAGYLRWILKQDFPEHVREICEAAIQSDPDVFARWLNTKFGDSPRAEPADRSVVQAV